MGAALINAWTLPSPSFAAVATEAIALKISSVLSSCNLFWISRLKSSPACCETLIILCPSNATAQVVSITIEVLTQKCLRASTKVPWQAMWSLDCGVHVHVVVVIVSALTPNNLCKSGHERMYYSLYKSRLHAMPVHVLLIQNRAIGSGVKRNHRHSQSKGGCVHGACLQGVLCSIPWHVQCEEVCLYGNDVPLTAGYLSIQLSN